jgi:hypothetical protein
MRHYLTFVFISAWAIPLGNAAPATCPSSGTYGTLMGLNTAGGCTIDNLLFSNFTFASTATGGAAPVAPSDLAISGVMNSAPSAVGFAFAGIPMVALLRQTSDVTLSYTVATASGEPIVTSAALTEAGQAIPDTGVATIDETLDSSALQTYFTSTLVQKPSDSMTFSGTASLSVSDHLHAAGGIVGTGQIAGFSNTFDEADAPVSEPGSPWLLACGLALVGGGAIRARRLRLSTGKSCLPRNPHSVNKDHIGPRGLYPHGGRHHTFPATKQNSKQSLNPVRRPDQ